MTADSKASDAALVDGDQALQAVCAGSTEGEEELRRVVAAVRESVRVASLGAHSGTSGKRYRCCTQVGATE